ncbi:hypothetical protein O6H91_07G120600 [Diphasiastrum complanatum]|uniref:Uncharacterized protein n=1 Tax=Diphasiastrum complanatum TaxID=34168 RepID=A0ACC2DA69_DIPCM|nr:hypothetical protein O6H91_07G120600 [Diphasiastrum complanatum]
MEAVVGGCPNLLHQRSLKLAFCVAGIMVTLLVYGLMQERIMRLPYGDGKEYFEHSLFIVFCNRALTCMITVILMLIQRKDIAPVAPLYKYSAVSLSNMLSTTCQYEALKYVSFPIQTLAKSAKMIPVMVWGMAIMQKKYRACDYLLAVSITAGCAVFLIYGEMDKITALSKNQSSLLGTLLMAGYLGFDGFTSTFQDKLFEGYNMDILNQILYVTVWSCALSVIEKYQLEHVTSFDVLLNSIHV